MSYVPRVDAAMTAEWPDLVDELDRWGSAGRIATAWWRDDDAVTWTPQLDALLLLADGVPVGLAVIPSLVQPELPKALGDWPNVAVLQHGWRHVNRAAQDKRSEYPAGRSAAAVSAELSAGRARLEALFGERAAAVLVPPWNRFADEFLPLLGANGISAFSTMASPRKAPLPPGLAAIDVHVDLVDWRGDRGFIGAPAALGRLVGQLRAKRSDPAGSAGPVGILTHHLVMDPPSTAFLARLLAVTRGHPAAGWIAAAELLQ